MEPDRRPPFLHVVEPGLVAVAERLGAQPFQHRQPVVEVGRDVPGEHATDRLEQVAARPCGATEVPAGREPGEGLHGRGHPGLVQQRTGPGRPLPGRQYMVVIAPVRGRLDRVVGAVGAIGSMDPDVTGLAARIEITGSWESTYAM